MHTEPIVHFGGPDLPPRHLRNLLRQKIDAVPSGGKILWATYYFRDRDLADALLAAAARGVRVIVKLESKPRLKNANDTIIAKLKPLGAGLYACLGNKKFGSKKRGYLHSKIYWFSHPRPHALIGSFNPSGDEPEDQAVVDEIGDQDRGHNLLVEFHDPDIVAALKKYIASIGNPLLRYMPAQNLGVSSGKTRLQFFPNLRKDQLAAHIARLPAGSAVQGAVSHLKPGRLLNTLASAARRGVRISLLIHDTERRVPEESVRALSEAGAVLKRYLHADRLPLHAKFIVVKDLSAETAYFGSYNFNERSRSLNHEVFAASTDPAIISRLTQRFLEIAADAARQG
jgi:phosphatidylserine/phosphatidylglycerophosphate/cardiolipin synthase-like enzyme